MPESPDAPPLPARQYAVFISYRHADNKDPGRQWASWLHHSLETYEVPPDLAGTPNAHGEPIAATLYPVFRDEEELPAGADLTNEIRQALERSRTLVVLCSPRAVGSRFVADEIRYFKELGKSAHILALMIDGEPNATDDPGKHAAGIPASAECLPEPLRFGLPRGDGRVDWAARAEPVCADVRPEGRPVQGWTTAAACRESLEREGAHAPDAIAARVQDYERRLEIAKLKIVAGALGVPLGILTQRDQEYRRREAERRASEERVRREEAERLQALAEQREKEANEANERRRQLLREISRSDVATAEAAFGDGKWRRGIAYLGRALTSDPENRAAMAWLWNEMTLGKCELIPDSLLAHQAGVKSARFSPDCQRIVTASLDKTARVWDAATGRALGEAMRHEDGVWSAGFSRDGLCIVTASNDKTARVWDAATGRALCEPMRHENGVVSANFSPDGLRIVTASDDQTARVWEAATGRALGEPMRHEARVLSASFSPDGLRIVTASWDKTARMWDAATGSALGEAMRHEARVVSARFSPDGLRIVTASDDQTARVWEAATGRALGVTMRHEDGVLSASFNPDGLRIVTTSIGGTVQVWDAATGRVLGEAMRHEDWVNGASFSPDGLRIVTASNDKTARMWDAATGQALGEAMRHQDGVRSASFSPDGLRIVTASNDKTARVWDAATGRVLGEAMRHKARVVSASFSPDGLRIVTASNDTTARIWDAATGRPSGEPMRHEGEVRSASFDPDGLRIVTASGRTARVWDPATGRVLGEPMRHEWMVRSASFSPDGLRIVTASDDKTARIWPVGFPQQSEDWLSDLVAAASGLRFNADGVLAEVPMPERLELREKLRALRPGEPGSSVRDRDWARLLRWWLTPPAQRPSLF